MMKIIPILNTFAFVMLLNVSCRHQETIPGNTGAIFPKGDRVPAEYFTGTAWLQGLVPDDSIFTTAIGNVVFEPGARSNWHSHPSGQILIVSDGVGYHQIRGQPIQIIRKGDVVKCPPDIVHWHGASEDSSMTHIYIVPNTENGIVKWMDPVTDEEYRNLAQREF